MRVNKILHQYNIGLPTLNDYLEMVGLEKVEINTKLDEHDSNLVVKLLNSQKLKDYEKALMELTHIKTELQKELFEEIPPIEEMGVLQRKYYFKTIRSRFWYAIYKYPLLRSKLLYCKTYSDELFGHIYNLYVSGKLKKMEEQRINRTGKETEETIQYKAHSIYDGSDIDEESMIMSALRHGDGDLFGY